MDLKTISAQFIAFEKTHQALDWQVDGIYAWRLVRFDVFQTLVSEKNLFEFAHPNQKNKKRNIKNHLRNLKSALFQNPFLRFAKKDYLFLVSPRKINGKDIYSDPIINAAGLGNSNILYATTPEVAYSNAASMGATALKIAMANIVANRLNITFFKQHDDALNQFAFAFNQFFGTNINLQKIIRRELFRFKKYEAAYIKLLRKTKPKHIFMVAHYGHFGMISAAKKCGIPTHEIQHGTLSTNHMGYYFPHNDMPPYMPDTLLCHGDHWTRKPPLPKSLNTHVIGAGHVSALLDTKPKIKNQVLIFSQGTVATELFAYAKSAAELSPDHKIIYRLHPSEIPDSYPTGNLPHNFEIRHDGATFFDDLTQSEFIATVYSTTIYEAMACGAKAIVIGLNGHNAVQDIIDNDDAQLAKTPKEFAEALKTAKPCPAPEKYYAPFDENIIKEKW